MAEKEVQAEGSNSPPLLRARQVLLDTRDEEPSAPLVLDSSDQKKVPEMVELKSDDTEIDGPQGPDPTRYGDWERNGRCIDF